jgi:hypothetical protein
MNWTITQRCEGSTLEHSHTPSAAALREFFDLCDRGPRGKYTLQSSQNAILATADVKAQEMTIKWHRDRIMYALGTAAAADEVEKAGTYLTEVDP